MRINDLLTESQLHQLDEGPIGAAIGRGVGGLAKGVGAVAGGVAGIGKALKKGYQSGKATVAGEPDPNAAPAAGATAPTAPAAGTAPATQPPAPTGAAPTTQQINKAGPKGTAPATAQTGAAAQALAKTAQATQGAGAAKAGQTLYAQVKASVNQLDKKGKQRIMQLLQKSVQAPAAAPAANAAAKPAAGGAMAQQLGAATPTAAPANTMANAPVSKTNVAKPGNPNAAPSGNYDPNTGQPISDKGKADVASTAAYKASTKGKEMDAWNAAVDAADAAGQTPPTLAQFRSSQTAQAPAAAPAAKAPEAEKPGFLKTATDKIQDKNKRPAKPSQAEIDADREARMGPTSDSIIRTGNNLSETLARKVEEQKRKMFETSLFNGTVSVFKK